MSVTSHGDAVQTNVRYANEHMQNLAGEQPTDVAVAGANIAQAFLLAALVNAVQELTEEIRKTREAR